MLLFSDKDRTELENFAKIADLSLFFNEKIYKASDTSLTYRQINSLNKLMEGKKENKKGWRKFSFKDLIFLEILTELRKYGFKDKQLTDLSDSFFRKKPTEDMMLQNENFMRNHEEFSMLAMHAVINFQNIFIMINENYYADYLYAFDISIYAERHKSLVIVSLSKVMSNVTKRLGLGELSAVNYGSMNASLSEKEIQILDIIRFDGYKNITIKMKNGKTEYIVKGENNLEIKEVQLIEMIKNKKFADIQITKRNGDIVNIKVEDLYKI